LNPRAWQGVAPQDNDMLSSSVLCWQAKSSEAFRNYLELLDLDVYGIGQHAVAAQRFSWADGRCRSGEGLLG
jgi:hypothetical protein